MQNSILGRYLGYVVYGGLWLLGCYRPPDRKLLEQVILPYYGSRNEFRRILFVGVRRYVTSYQRFFVDKRYVTIDPVPHTRWFGAACHVMDRVENADRYFDGESFDLIVMNGVIGWGLNDEESIERALKVCSYCLRQGGELVLGLNEERLRGSKSAWVLDDLEPFEFPQLESHRFEVTTPLPERSHTYLFYRKAEVRRNSLQRSSNDG